MGRVPLEVWNGPNAAPGWHPGGRLPLKPETSRLPTPRPYGLRAVRGPGRAREATGHSASRCDGRKRADRFGRERVFRSRPWMTYWRPPADPSRRRPKSSSMHWNAYLSRSAGVKHCKGDHVPTLRPLLAVAGPPRQYGPKPCSAWPSAGLQRPRPVHSCRSKHLSKVT